MGSGVKHEKNLEYTKIALLLVLSALAIVLHIFQWPYPPATYLKFDLAGVPIAVLMLLDTKLGLVSLPIFWIGAVILAGDPTKIVGPSMKVFAEASTAIPLALVVKFLDGRGYGYTKTFAVGFVSALIGRVGVMLALNYLIAPYWLVWVGWMESFEAAYKYTVDVVLPAVVAFNAIVVCYVAPLSLAIWRSLRKYAVL